MKWVLMFFCCLPLLVCAQKGKKEVLYAFEDTGSHLFGYKTKSGTIVLPPKYSKIFITDADLFTMNTYRNFTGGFVYVSDNRGIVAIDRIDSVLFEPVIFGGNPDELSEFSERLVRFKEKGKIGFVNSKGERVIPAIFDSVWWFDNGMAAFQEYKNGKWGFINRKGRIVIEAKYDKVIHPFSGGKAPVIYEGKEVVIDKKGRITPHFSNED